MAPGPLTRELQFEKKNKDLIKLPKYAKIQKRPIPHPPISSPYSGPQTPKTVYISTKTPFMSAVKRIQKLLLQAEKRATSSARVDLTNSKLSEKEKLARVARGDEELRRRSEEVSVKATGRAIERALSVGRWFEGRSEEYAVRVSTGCVLVVDDVVEDEEEKRRLQLLLLQEEGERQRQQQQQQQQGKGKENNGDEEENVSVPAPMQQPPAMDSTEPEPRPEQSTSSSTSSKAAGKGKKRKRTTTIPTDVELPETRTRWVNMVEVAVSLK